MKYFYSAAFLLTIIASTAHGGDNLIISECKDYVQKNYVKGDWGSKYGNQRIWDFKKLVSKFKSDSIGQCDGEAFSQAITDSNERWISVKRKNGCPNAEVKECETAQANLNLMGLYQKILKDHSKKLQAEALACDDELILPNAKEIESDFKVISHKLHENIRNEIPTTEHGFQCVEKITDGLKANAKAIYSSLANTMDVTLRYAPSMGVYLKAAVTGTLPQHYSEMRAMRGRLEDEIEKSVRDFVDDIAKKVDKAQRFENSFERTRFICDLVGTYGPSFYAGNFVKSKMAGKKQRLKEAAKKMEETQEAERSAFARNRSRSEGAPSRGPSPTRESTRTGPEAHPEIQKIIKDIPGAKSPTSVLSEVDIKHLDLNDSIHYMQNITGASDWKKGYRSLISKLHPDRFSNASPNVKELITKESSQLNELKVHIDRLSKMD
jgi:hypothetical protein